ncbi:MAG: FtsX-like permease family protein [Gammaproteobacteria bacterium]|nr:FtsX-like permease family protein [Gammaproteobacteria bacterium]
MSIVLRLAWRNLWRQPRRTWLTTGAMVFSNVLLVFMMSFQFGMYDLMIENTLKIFTGHVQVQAPGYLDDKKMRQTVADIVPLADSLRTGLKSNKVAARGITFALASSEERSYGIMIYGVEPGFEPEVSTVPGLIIEGEYFSGIAAAEIVVGSVLARNLKVGLGDEITLLGSGVDGSFAAAVATVKGIFESGVVDLDRNIAEIPLQFFDDTFYMQGAGHQISIFAADLNDVGDLQIDVQKMLPAGSNLVVPDWNLLQPGVRQAIQADMSSAFFMYFVLVILVSFSVLNTQLMSVLERTHEFGIVMALGLRPGRLGRLVLIETALMGLMGMLLGMLAGAVVTLWVAQVGFSIPGMDEMAVQFNLPATMHPSLTLFSLTTGPAVVFVFTILAACYPALRMHWQKPVEAMRAV